MEPESARLIERARREKEEQWGPRPEKAITYAVGFLEKTEESVTARSLWGFFSDKTYRKEVLGGRGRGRLWGPELPKSAMRIGEEALWRLQHPLRRAVDEVARK